MIKGTKKKEEWGRKMERECDDFEERGERVMVSERERERDWYARLTFRE